MKSLQSNDGLLKSRIHAAIGIFADHGEYLAALDVIQNRYDLPNWSSQTLDAKLADPRRLVADLIRLMNNQVQAHPEKPAVIKRLRRLQETLDRILRETSEGS